MYWFMSVEDRDQYKNYVRYLNKYLDPVSKTQRLREYLKEDAEIEDINHHLSALEI